ncbi:MAG: DUF2017 domain-containing protein [Marmoricola sp.]
MGDSLRDAGFHRHRRSGRCIATFAAVEGDLLRSLAGQLVELLRNGEAQPGASDPLEAMLDFSGPTTEPEDPVLQRLLPTAYPDDEEAAADFRRFTESTLRNGKAEAAGLVIDTLEEAGLPDEPEAGLVLDVELDEAAAMTWLRSLTDMRLALATRLGIEDDDDEDALDDLPPDDPRAAVHAIYHWLGFLQETLVEAVQD